MSRYALIAITAFLVGCKQSTDLDSIRALQAAAESARASYDDLAADYYQSCVRTVEYQNIAVTMAAEPNGDKILKRGDSRVASAPFKSLKIEQVVNIIERRDLLPAEVSDLIRRTDLSAILASVEPAKRAVLTRAVRLAFPTPRVVETECASSQVASADWQIANHVLMSYFDALGNLAGESRAKDPFGLKGLAADVHAAGLFSATQASDIGALGNSIVSGVFDAKRRGVLSQYIATADEALGKSIDALTAAGTDHYVFLLKQESDEMASRV